MTGDGILGVDRKHRGIFKVIQRKIFATTHIRNLRLRSGRHLRPLLLEGAQHNRETQGRQRHSKRWLPIHNRMLAEKNKLPTARRYNRSLSWSGVWGAK
jgi:hypothetical protein